MNITLELFCGPVIPISITAVPEVPLVLVSPDEPLEPDVPEELAVPEDPEDPLVPDKPEVPLLPLIPPVISIRTVSLYFSLCLVILVIAGPVNPIFHAPVIAAPVGVNITGL